MTSPGLFVPGGLIIHRDAGAQTHQAQTLTPHPGCCVHLHVAECSVTSPPSGASRTENKELASTCALRGLCCSLCYNQMSATSQIYSERKSEFHAQIRPEIELHLLCQENLDPVSWSFSGNHSAWSPERAESSDQKILPVNTTPWIQGNCTQGDLGPTFFFFLN